MPPEIIELESKMEATEGNEATFHCQASGFPRPVYAWLDPVSFVSIVCFFHFAEYFIKHNKF